MEDSERKGDPVTKTYLFNRHTMSTEQFLTLATNRVTTQKEGKKEVGQGPNPDQISTETHKSSIADCRSNE